MTAHDFQNLQTVRGHRPRLQHKPTVMVSQAICEMVNSGIKKYFMLKSHMCRVTKVRLGQECPDIQELKIRLICSLLARMQLYGNH